MYYLLQDWEHALQNQEGPVEQIQDAYNQLGTGSPQADAKIHFINEKWDQMISLGNAYAERLAYLKHLLTVLDSLRKQIFIF